MAKHYWHSWLRRTFWIHETLLDGMVQDDPEKRSNMNEVVERSEEIIQGLSQWKLRSRTAKPDTSKFDLSSKDDEVWFYCVTTFHDLASRRGDSSSHICHILCIQLYLETIFHSKCVSSPGVLIATSIAEIRITGKAIYQIYCVRRCSHCYQPCNQ